VPPLTAQVDIVERLCRKYNKTAMALLETRAYAQAKELLLKAQVCSKEYPGGAVCVYVPHQNVLLRQTKVCACVMCVLTSLIREAKFNQLFICPVYAL